MLILSGDIGGTNTRLQLTEYYKNQKFDVLHRQNFSNANFKSFPEILNAFALGSDLSLKKIDQACFAVAGPISDGKVQFTNLPWFIEESRLEAELNLKSVKLINDFEAIGYGIQTLSSENMSHLQTGNPQKEGPISIIGAGTGLGVALLHTIKISGKTKTQPLVTATEGGHVDFAPTDDSQMQLLSYLRKKHHRVSVERVLSGPGLTSIYKFCRDFPLYNQQENSNLKFLVHNAADPAADILHYAVKEGDPISLRAMDIFIKCYGAVCGNLALTTLPRGGLYIVGGIAPKILSLLQDGRFLDSFLDKGRMTNLLKEIPVRVVLDAHIGLQGAANYGYQLTQIGRSNSLESPPRVSEKVRGKNVKGLTSENSDQSQTTSTTRKKSMHPQLHYEEKLP
jgi:glucokinase